MDFGPPIIVKPSHELFGEVLLGLGRTADAKLQFEMALQRAPRRSQSLAGLARVARAIEDGELEARVCEELDSILAVADQPVREASPCHKPEIASR